MGRLIDADSLKDRVLEDDAYYSDEVINHFIDVIDAEPVAWIPVSERLPVPYVDVLISDENGDIKFCYLSEDKKRWCLPKHWGGRHSYKGKSSESLDAITRTL